ncbi:MAG: hypothetical protein M0Q99_12410, partial [Candidatus Cloacimonetes bacterium]|nr:hypothetical protein [Candidatus Cloacimonadota bacterium]
MKTTKIMGAILVAVLALALFAGVASAVPYIAPVDGSQDALETIVLKDGSNTTLNTIFAGRITADVVGTFVGNYSGVSGDTYQIFYPKTTLNVYLNNSGTSAEGKSLLTTSKPLDVIVGSNIVGQAASAGKTYGYKLVFTTPAGGTTSVAGAYAGGTYLTTAKLPLNLTGAETGTWKVYAQVTNMSTYASSTYKNSNVVSFIYGATVSSSITASKDKIILGESVLLTIKGEPKVNVTVNVTGGDSGIRVLPGQSDVTADTFNLTKNFTVKLDDNGVRTVEIGTANSTVNADAKTYTFTGTFNASTTTAKAKVTVEQGVVTITAGKDAYFVGDEITLSGTATGGDKVYLYIKGTNKKIASLGATVAGAHLPAGGYLNVLGGASFVTVKSDDTWEKKITLLNEFDAGTYTVYASPTLIITDVPEFANDVDAATLSLPLKQPFLTATAESSVVAQGDKIKITGTAEAAGNDLKYYVFGTNYFSTGDITVEDDASYEVEIATTALDAGQYFVVVQHPMYDGAYNVAPFAQTTVAGVVTDYAIVYNSQAAAATTGINPVTVAAPNAILFYTLDRQSSNAAEALCQQLDNQNIDDIYVKLTFIVAQKTLTMNPVSDVTKGSALKVSGTTNVKAGETVTVDVLSTAFTAIDKSSVNSASFISLTTKVVKGADGVNTWEVTFDTTGLNVD